MIRFCKVLSGLTFVLGFAYGLMEMVEARSAHPAASGWPVALLIWVLTLLAGTVLLALARGLERLDDIRGAIRDNRRALEELNDRLNAVSRAVGVSTAPAPSDEPLFRHGDREPEMWQCVSCHAMNASTELSCKECGTPR